MSDEFLPRLDPHCATVNTRRMDQMIAQDGVLGCGMQLVKIGGFLVAVTGAAMIAFGHDSEEVSLGWQAYCGTSVIGPAVLYLLWRRRKSMIRESIEMVVHGQDRELVDDRLEKVKER